MINAIVWWLTGYQKLRLRDENKEQILDHLISARIPFRRLSCDQNGVASLYLQERYARRLLENGEAERLEERGLPSLIKRYRRRPGILCALVLMILIWTVSSLFVWEIRIQGLETLKRKDITARLEKQGLQVGSYIGSLDLWRIQNAYLIDDERLEWITVNRRGTVIFVNIREQRDWALSEDENSGRISVLCADSEGMITSVETASGDALVHPGDVVERGTPLISGLHEKEEGIYRMERAVGSVYAETFYTIRFEVPLVQTRKRYTGEVFTEKTLHFFAKPVKLFINYGNSPALCDRIENETVYTLPGGAVLPLSVRCCRILPYRETQIRLDEKTALTVAEQELHNRMERELADAQIDSIETIPVFSDDTLTVTCTIGCIRNIAREQFVSFTEAPAETETAPNTDETG